MNVAAGSLPENFRDETELEDFMTQPSDLLRVDLGKAPGDLIVLGVGGKMGPTLARLAKRAAPERRVIGVARFSEAGLREKLQAWDIECIEADLLDRASLEKLPKTANVVFMAGRKFGSTGAEYLTWAMNAHVPAMVAEVFAKSRIVAFSTGCVYPYVDVEKGGATEDVAAVPPPGAYANSCVAREAMFEHFSRKYETPGRVVRLNYAIDMRYGVLHDVASKVFAGRAIDLTAGHVNVIWQGDANTMILRLLGHCTTPTTPINISGPETISIRWLAGEFGNIFGKQPQFTGKEAADGWLVNTSAARKLLGEPPVPLERMIRWTADWISRGARSLGKETHYDTRDGSF
ncbi:MAG: NAD(P)-dependent oxidoreductase [Xanthobacteraceae bacterium]|nr:NAD(P)-dependent oxidoreductase [Xanthobacteraceae bacterium]